MESLKSLPNSENDRFSQGLGVELIEATPGRAVCELAIRQGHLNAAGVAHGGVVFALADAAGASALNAGDSTQLTINSSINIIRPTPAGSRLRAVATVLHSGKTISTCQVEVRNGDKLVATLLAQAARA